MPRALPIHFVFVLFFPVIGIPTVVPNGDVKRIRKSSPKIQQLTQLPTMT